MNVISVLEDKRIKSVNVLVEFKIDEYLEFADALISNNPFQRKRVKSSSTVYSLLREDLKIGCIIPPVVLALGKQCPPELFENFKKDDSKLVSFIKENLPNAMILDGLQRSYNIIDAKDELVKSGDEEGKNTYLNNKLRCEFYLGIDKIGILYRMLTLNTGQTPMSIRHQIEILYSDYLVTGIEGVKLIKETEAKPPALGEYNFKDIIDGFTSYLLRDFLTLDRSDILENIKSLEKLSRENQGKDIFINFTQLYNNFQIKMRELSGDWFFNADSFDYALTANPFGRDINGLFNKSQVMTGLGAAVGFLKDNNLNDFEKILNDDLPKISFPNEINIALNNLVAKLDDIRQNATKIGNAQRAYFYYFFRELFNPQGDSYLNINEAIENAHKRYRQNA